MPLPVPVRESPPKVTRLAVATYLVSYVPAGVPVRLTESTL